jgi:hypothetical protein
MPRKRAKNPRLTDRDYEVLQHLLRYRITTREVLQKLFFPGSELNAATKVTSRLVEHGYLNRYELYKPRSYFTLGPRAARLLGISANKTEGLGPTILAREYAVFAFCCCSEPPRQRLTVSEIRLRHSQYLQRKIDCSHYYLDNDGETTRLAYIHVDRGHGMDYIVRTCRDQLQARYAHRPYADLIDNDRFMIAIITALQEKVSLIEEALSRHDWPIRFRVEVVPDLIYLISSYH